MARIRRRRRECLERRKRRDPIVLEISGRIRAPLMIRPREAPETRMVCSATTAASGNSAGFGFCPSTAGCGRCGCCCAGGWGWGWPSCCAISSGSTFAPIRIRKGPPSLRTHTNLRTWFGCGAGLVFRIQWENWTKHRL